ncbi:DUF308 domain-containing protein [Enterococcus sp. BWM-S5]|uniref:DUF308 domain-containing protein n=1 Tax=Enterococcus larvae TaxID=2794352 RepID=A0ABS4CIR7_9ENTE|nr:DUF308 domain-containing protein [Enterococcus larvae]MBP1046516.1 DUF308 domain-containing protein [Enterococcus larvae]
MDTLIHSIKKYALLRGIIYILLGLAVVINPSAVFKVAVYAVSGYLAFMGILDLLDGIKEKRTSGVYNSSFVLGIFLLIVAAIVLIFAKGIVSILPIFLGLLIAVFGLSRIVQSFNLKQYVNVNWTLFFIYGVILLIGGLLLVFNPFRSVLFLFQLFGGILIFMGISEFLTFLQLRKIDD